MMVEQTDRDAAFALSVQICGCADARQRDGDVKQLLAYAKAAEQRGREAERAEIVAWLRDQDGHGYDDMRADAIEARQHKVAV